MACLSQVENRRDTGRDSGPMERIDQQLDDDCLTTCLEMLLGDRPRYIKPNHVADFWQHYEAEVEARGQRLVYCSGRERRKDWERELPSEGYWIAVVPSLNGREVHAVVMDGRRLFHDPARRRKRVRRARVFFYGIRLESA